MILTILLLFLIYFVPGFSLSRIFFGRLKKSLFFYLFLSFLVVPLIYSFLVTFKILSLPSFVFAQLLFLLISFLIGQRMDPRRKINLDYLIPHFPLNFWLISLVFSFFLLVMSPRLGLWQGYLAIGDDQHQIRKTVSIAESDNEPLFYHFPTTRLTIYYSNNVAAGLLVKFSNNFLKANQAWFIHVGLQTALMLWLILRVGGSLLKNNFQRVFFVFGLTYFSGLEFFLYKFKGLGYIDQLEWWTDWLLPQSQIHMQITNPYNLFFWVPQHLFAGLLVLIIFIFLNNGEKNKLLSRLFLGIILASILGNSAFIFLSSVLVYAVYTLILLVRQKDLKLSFRFNLPIFLAATVFSAKNLELFLTAEKGHYFVWMANVFWFLPNSNFFNKLINLSLTVPLYLLVEFGFLFPVLIYSLVKFIRDRDFREHYLFLCIFIFLFPVIFFVKSLDDNNISMRSFIPIQILLSIFCAEFFSELKLGRAFKFILLVVFMFFSLPSGLFDFSLRLREQFNQGQKQELVYYKWIDRNLPLKSIIFARYSEVDKVSSVGHRFSFKDPELFSATDREHNARSQVSQYIGVNFGEGQNVYQFLKDNWSRFEEYGVYTTFESGISRLPTTRLTEINGLSIYSAQIKF